MFQEQDGCYEDHDTFAIVDLHCDGTLQVAIVPDFWLFGDEGELYCFYPPRKSTITPIKMRHDPDTEIWPNFRADFRKSYSSYEFARKSLSSAVQYTDLSEDEDLEPHLETNGPNLRRSMRRKKKPFAQSEKKIYFGLGMHCFFKRCSWKLILFSDCKRGLRKFWLRDIVIKSET